MNQDAFQMGNHVVEQIFDKTLADGKVCLFLYNQSSNHLDCIHRGNCMMSSSRCNVSLSKNAVGFSELLDARNPDGYSTVNKAIPTCETLPIDNSQILIPIKDSHNLPLGLAIFESDPAQKVAEQQLKFIQSVAQICMPILQKSRSRADSDKMVSKLRQLSDTSNVLLSDFDNRPLDQKLDHVVKQALEILDAELCSLWLVKNGKISLEMSYSLQGKVDFEERVLPIVDAPKSGMTGGIAFQKKVFNAFGDGIDTFPARNPENPVDFVDSSKIYSELACPILDSDNNLIGLLIAFNKRGEDGKPLQGRGFSEDFDEPLMKILTTKIAISIRNAEQLKKLRSYELIIESTPDPVIISARTGEIIYMNPGGVKIFGNLVGRPVADFYPSDENSKGIDKARDIRVQLSKQADKRLKNFETEFMSADGQVIPISLSVSPLRDEHGDEAGTIGIAKDLREIKDLLSAGQSLLETHDIEEILSRITRTCLRLQNSLRAYVKLYDKESDMLVFRALNSKKVGDTFPVAATPKYQGMTGFVFLNQKPHISNDVFAEPEVWHIGIFDDVKSKISVPITYVDKETETVVKLGVISVDSDKLDAFSNHDLYFLLSLANQAASGLQNASLIASKNKSITQLRAFDRVQQATTGKHLQLDHIYDALLDAVVDILGFDYATISAVDAGKQLIGTTKGRNVAPDFITTAWHRLDSKDIQAWVARHQVHVYLTGWDERLDEYIFRKYGHEKLVRVIIPIIARGDVLGTLETGYDKIHKSIISDEEINTLQKLVDLAGVGIEHANLLERLTGDIALRNELEEQLDALNQASVQILNSTTEAEAITHIFVSLKRIGYTKGMLSLVNEDAGKIEGRYPFGYNWQQIPSSRVSYDLKGSNILSHALHTKQPVLCKNCANDLRWDRKLAREFKIKSQYIIPLIVKNQPIGTLQIDLSDWPDVVHGDEDSFRRRMKVLETFASQSAIAIRNTRNMFTIDRLEENIAETAHEIRAPLHNIMTQLGGLKASLEHNKDEKEINRFVDRIEEQIYRTKRQVDNSLLLSDRTRLTLELDYKEGRIQDTIGNCVDWYKLRAFERGISIIVRDKVKMLPRFKFDPDKIEQVIINLIDNAVKYSHYNQFIEILGFDDGTKIHIEISDRGLGIPPNEIETIFQGFTRSEAKDKTRTITGTGLGLKICKEITEQHGGDIGVTSVPASQNRSMIEAFQNYKTTFKLTLPKFPMEKK
jgi:PAS domain S-box-containing protein